MRPRDGKTISGLATNVFAHIWTNTDMINIKVTQTKPKKTILAFFDMVSSAMSATEVPLCLTDIIREEKSCTPPIKIVPNMIHNIVGPHPHMETARIGPTMGAAPAIEAK